MTRLTESIKWLEDLVSLPPEPSDVEVGCAELAHQTLRYIKELEEDIERREAHDLDS